MTQSKYKFSVTKGVKKIEKDTFELKTDLSNEQKNNHVKWLVSMNSGLNYFECEIIAKRETECGIWIGIGSLEGNQKEFVRCQIENGDVHYRDVNIGQSSGKGIVKLNFTCSQDDKIGCGIDFDDDSTSMEIFFTKNGMQVGDLIKCKKPSLPICPMVGIGEKGERIHFLQHRYRPSLLSAVRRRDTAMTKTLIVQESSDPLSQETDNSTIIKAFQEACCQGLADMIQPFLELSNGDELITKKVENGGLNALQIATKNKRSDVLQILLKRDATQEALGERDQEGCTLLLVAAKNGDEDSFRSLLQYVLQRKQIVEEKKESCAADVENKSRSKESTKTTDEVHVNPYGIVSPEPEDSSSKDATAIPLQPIKSSQVQTESEQKDSGAQVQTESKQKDSETKRREIIEKMKKQYPDFFVQVPSTDQDEQGLTNILHLAAENGHENIIKVLWSQDFNSKNILFGSLMIQTDKDGNTPLHLGCQNDHKLAAQELMAIMGEIGLPQIVDNRNRETRQTPMHVAAAEGHPDMIKILVDAEADVLARDRYWKTPLHLAARNGRVKAVKYLMQITVEKTQESDDKKKKLEARTYLDEAIKNDQREVVDVILDNPISNSTFDDITYSDDTMSLLIKHMPDTAKCVLDSCIKCTTQWKADEECTVELNYDKLKSYLGKTKQEEGLFACTDESTTEHEPENITYGWKNFLQSLKECKDEDLIKHPIVEGFIYNVWNKTHFWWIFYLFLGIHVMFVAMLTVLFLLLNNPTTSICQSIFSGQFNNLDFEAEVNISMIPDTYSDVITEYFTSENFTVIDNFTNISSNDICSSTSADIRYILTTFTAIEISCSECGIKSSIIAFIRALAVILIIFSAVKLFAEFVQFLYSLCDALDNPKSWWLYFNYFTDFSNWLEVPLYILTITFVSFQFNSDCTCVGNGVWSTGIASLFLAWASLILFLRKLDLFDTGVYVLMLEILLKRFLKTIILTSFLVIMFALTFYLTFNQIDPSFAVSPFSFFHTSLWKMMTMITGEMDYESIFRQSSSGTLDPDPPLPFPVISYVLWIAFLITIPILLNNMLVGLAVDDIKEILKTAEVNRLKSKIELIVNMTDLMLISTLFIYAALIPAFCLLYCICCPCITVAYACNKKLNPCTLYHSFLDFLLKEREPKIVSKEVHPFKSRSPLSVSRHYKSAENLVKVVQKPSSEEKVPDLLKAMESTLMEKMEKCLKEEMKTHFKLMEDNVVKRMEHIAKVSEGGKPGVSDSTTAGVELVQESP